MTLERPRELVADGSACPEAERLAEYADGMLPEAERVSIERHLVGCADCRSALVEAARFRDYDGAEAMTADRHAHKVVWFRRRWPMAVAGLAAAAALLLIVRLVRPDLSGGGSAGRSRPELAELVAAASTSPTRLVEGRLTGGFAYAPPPSATRGALSADVPASVRLAAAGIESRAGSGRSPEDLAALGVAYLAVGDLDRAIATLETAAALAPSNAALASDLSAAYVARGARSGAEDDLRRAVSAADRAIAIDPNLLEARFNRGIALALLPSPDLSGMKDYIQRDSGPWAEEARQRLQGR